MSTATDQSWPRRLPTGCGKVSHPTRRDAEQERKVMERQEKKSGCRFKINVFFCVQCNAWHIGRSHMDGISRSGRRL